jgi:hypothetical protein
MNIETRKNNIGLRKSTWRKKSRKRSGERNKGTGHGENKAAVNIS